MPRLINIRCSRAKDESSRQIPSEDAGTPYDSDQDLEAGKNAVQHDEDCGAIQLKRSPSDFHSSGRRQSQHALPQSHTSTDSRWTRRTRRIPISLLPWLSCGRRNCNTTISACKNCASRTSPLRRILKCLGIALMLLGLIEFIILITGLLRAFFPDEFDYVYESWRYRRPSNPQSHWPTDYTADTLPVRCHSHNDYWRTVPLQSAISAGCTGVEADVWLYGDELYVGHSTSSLTPQRTLRNLYIDPLVDVLERQNPNTTFHPILDTPRNGVFDTDSEETLVLLIDFKTDGQELWRHVSEQLEPLRSRQYLTHFNGTSVVSGPITVVVTGNAPFNRVIENTTYRDMFFDAPLELLGSLAPTSKSDSTLPPAEPVFDPVQERAYLATYGKSRVVQSEFSNQGQGQSGAAPTNPAVYTLFNSYYASVSFTGTIGHVLPYLRNSQCYKIRQQIAGAHAQGLKVRYWNTPSWPRGLRNYIWRVLVVEGVDYLNVDDLRGATMGNWGEPPRGRRWGLAGWDAWGGGWGALARSHADA